jgi:3',5'-cyclic AMP phosphodiesterase CpdA
MKIIHLTDLHIGVPRCTEIISNMVSWIRTTRSPDDHVVVISGDIGDTAEFLPLALATLAPLFPFHVLKIPGNHDYGHSGLSMAWTCVQQFDQHIYGGDGRFPKVDRIGNITFIGLDSIREKFFWDDPPDLYDDSNRKTTPKQSAEGLQGCLGLSQRNALNTILSELPSGDRAVLYLHHDPIKGGISMELLDRAPLKKVVTTHGDKVTALLCGHTHKFSADTAWNSKCYNGGTAGARDGGEPDLRIIDLTTGEVMENFD